MEVIFDRCGFIDVHKETLTACIMVGRGKRLRKEIKTYSTMTGDIENLRDWFKSAGVQKVGMESIELNIKSLGQIIWIVAIRRMY